jgi:hypothetical protein
MEAGLFYDQRGVLPVIGKRDDAAQPVSGSADVRFVNHRPAFAGRAHPARRIFRVRRQDHMILMNLDQSSHEGHAFEAAGDAIAHRIAHLEGDRIEVEREWAIASKVLH